jgi:hypothetical protein
MTISPDGISARFNEPRELFDVEQSGAKQNTVKFIDAYEAHQIRNTPPTKIFISCQQEIFCRTLTDVHLSGEILGKVIATFSWANLGHWHGISYNPCTEEAPASEEPSIDERFVAITISKGTLALLQSVAHGRTMNAVIRDLHEAYLKKKAEERGPLHD